MTGIAVGGFGMGALIAAPIAPTLITQVGVLRAFAYLGIAYLLVTIVAGLFIKDPPDGWQPQGHTTHTLRLQCPTRDYSLREALGTWQWWALWLILFLNSYAGLSVIAQEGPMFRELTHVGSAVAASMAGLSVSAMLLAECSGRGSRIRSHVE